MPFVGVLSEINGEKVMSGWKFIFPGLKAPKGETAKKLTKGLTPALPND